MTNHKLIEAVTKSQLRTDLPSFRPGDTLRVHVRIIEGTRERIQVFEGIVIKRRGGGVSETFTVRKISSGVGVERTFPLHTPKIEKIEVKRRGKVRRAKLYYLRSLRGKAARIQEIRYIAIAITDTNKSPNLFKFVFSIIILKVRVSILIALDKIL